MFSRTKVDSSLLWLYQLGSEDQFDIDMMSHQISLYTASVMVIRVTGNFNEILMLHPSSFVEHITQVIKGKSISFTLIMILEYTV